MLLRQCLQGITDVVESVAEVLAAVPGDEHEATAGVEACHVVTACIQRFGKTRVKTRIALYLRRHPMQGIDDGVARHCDVACIDILLQKILAAQRCGREIVSGYTPRYLAVYLFRPRTVNVVCTETCLNMCHGYLAVERGECGGSACRGVAMHEKYVGAALLEHIAHTEQHTRGDVVEVLSLLHYVEVEVGFYVEEFQNLIEHLTVLARNADDCLKLFAALLERFHQRSHLDGLRAGSEHEHYLFHIYLVDILFPCFVIYENGILPTILHCKADVIALFSSVQRKALTMLRDSAAMRVAKNGRL